MQKFAGISAPIMPKDVEHNKALTDGNALEQQSYSQLYGDNVFEKCGINRDGAGEVGKPRYSNGKRHF